MLSQLGSRHRKSSDGSLSGSGRTSPFVPSECDLLQMSEELSDDKLTKMPGDILDISDEREKVGKDAIDDDKKYEADELLKIDRRKSSVRKKSYSEKDSLLGEDRQSGIRRSRRSKRKKGRVMIGHEEGKIAGENKEIDENELGDKFYKSNAAYKRSLSHPAPPIDLSDLQPSPPSSRYERSMSDFNTRPVIQVIPPPTPTPPIITLTAEYTSLGDELETFCLTRLSPHPPPSSPTGSHHLKLRHQSDSAYAAVSSNVARHPLRDAEDADYNFMEGIIQRRMHRDSENLAISLEDLCSIVTAIEESDLDEMDKVSTTSQKDYHVIGSSGDVPMGELLKFQHTSDTNVADSHSYISSQLLGVTSTGSLNRRVPILGSPTRDLRSPTHDLRSPLRDLRQWRQHSLQQPEQISRSLSPHSFEQRAADRRRLSLHRRQSLEGSSTLQVPLVMETEGIPPTPVSGDQQETTSNETQC